MAKETDGGGGKMYRLWRARRVLLWAAALLLPVSCLLTVHLVQTTAAAAPEPLKWVDFTPTYEAMQAALQMDIATVESETHLDWIESLAWLGCRYGGNFSRYRYSDLAALRKKRESGQSMAELAEGNPYYDYYYRAYSAVLGALSGAVTIYVGFCLLWGVDYYTDSFQDKSGIYAQPVALEDLQAVTAYFAYQVSAAADGVARDGDGVFAEDRRSILENSVHAYDALEEEYPLLAFADTGVKPVYFSRLLSALDFTGIYCPFTGESNVNVDSPASMLPATAAHELAHQRGITSEQECNFLAILAATTCGDDVYAYSGWLSGYIYLGNALYRVDPEAYWAIRNALPETVQADLRYQNEYWDQFEDKAPQKVSNRVYDSFLKGYGQELGLQSYGTVVDLLVTYYKDRI